MDDNHCLEQQPFSGLSEKEIAVHVGKHVCAFCDEKFTTLKELKKHYEVSHDEIELKHEERVFNTDESFKKWKKEEEVRTKCGIAKLKSERKRHKKIGGSVKWGKTCPAFMTAIREQNEEAIKITLQSTNLCMLVMKCRLKCPPTEKLGILTKKDLHNVSRDFEVDESILHAEDAVSVDLQVKKMQRDSYNPVLIYKPLGFSLANNPLIKKQDFILDIMTEAQLEFLELYGKNIIMMDSTHGTNQYGYLLTTIMVSDDNHEGLPIAVCYSNRVSSDVLEPFSEEIKNRLPHLKPKVFMSDYDPAFCNAWRRGFGEVRVYFAVQLACVTKLEPKS
ncbi:uncharacterized protein TNCV_250501 [Trichonephila clavipes]|nr:uncharacterized protein TNCV_250501 [Trichonephila clavipes]